MHKIEVINVWSVVCIIIPYKALQSNFYKEIFKLRSVYTVQFRLSGHQSSGYISIIRLRYNVYTVYAIFFAYRYFSEFGLNFCKFWVREFNFAILVVLSLVQIVMNQSENFRDKWFTKFTKIKPPQNIHRIQYFIHFYSKLLLRTETNC